MSFSFHVEEVSVGNLIFRKTKKNYFLLPSLLQDCALFAFFLEIEKKKKNILSKAHFR